MGSTFKVLTYNIHHGLSSFRKHDVIDDIKEVLFATKADIVCLQEVIREDYVTPGALEMACKKVWKNGAYGKTIAFPKNAQGNCTLSRLPITYQENIEIPSGRWQPRGLLRTDVLTQGHGKPLIVLCTHLGLTRTQRQQQGLEIISYIRSIQNQNAPIILAGDFNDWQGDLSKMLDENINFKEVFFSCQKRHARTFPAYMPFLCLDRIYFHGVKLLNARVVKEAGWLGRPDHLPLLAEFDYMD